MRPPTGEGGARSVFAMIAGRSARSLLGSRIARNVLTLNLVRGVDYLFPLITVPFLTRVLGVSGWGQVAYAQSYAMMIGIFLDYGFGLSATREVARHRAAPDELSRIVAGVLGAKLVMTAALIGLAPLVLLGVPLFRANLAYFWAATFYAICLGVNVGWYYQGHERMPTLAALSSGAKAIALVLLLTLVTGPADGWLVLVIQGAGFGGASLAGIVLMYRSVAFRRPEWTLVREGFSAGWSLFLFKLIVASYTSAAAFVLGFFAPPEAIGYFAGAQKLVGVFLGIPSTVGEAMLPRISHVAGHSSSDAGRLVRVSLVVMTAGTILTAGFLIVAGPWIIRLVLGQGFGPSVPLLRILALTMPLIAVSNVLGIQWMLPFRMDRLFNTIIFGGAVVNIALVLLLVPRWSSVGMACAVAGAEAVITGAMICVLLRRGFDPHRVGGGK